MYKVPDLPDEALGKLNLLRVWHAELVVMFVALLSLAAFALTGYLAALFSLCLFHSCWLIYSH